MAVNRVSPGQLPKVLNRKHTRILRAIGRGGLRGAERGRTYIVRQTPVDQGQLKATWKVMPGNPGILQGKPTGIAGRLMGVRIAELRNTAPHAGIVELGARPHKTSVEGWLAIYDWVVRHRVELGLVTKSGKARRVKKGKQAVHAKLPDGGKGLDPEIAGIAWAIVRKIEKKGQEPTYFVKSSLDTLLRIVQLEVDSALAADGGKA